MRYGVLKCRIPKSEKIRFAPVANNPRGELKPHYLYYYIPTNLDFRSINSPTTPGRAPPRVAIFFLDGRGPLLPSAAEFLGRSSFQQKLGSPSWGFRGDGTHKPPGALRAPGDCFLSLSHCCFWTLHSQRPKRKIANFGMRYFNTSIYLS